MSSKRTRQFCAGQMHRSSEEIPVATSHLNWYANFVIFHPIQKLGNGECKLGVHRTQNLDTRIVGNLWPHAATPRTRGRVEAWRCATRQELRRNAAAAAAGMGITGASVNTWQIPLPQCQGKGNKNNTLKNQALLEFVLNLRTLTLT